MKISAGTLLFKIRGEGCEVLLVHPSGNYNRKAPWGIPKGLPDEGESLEDAARRETREETGVEAPKSLLSLGSIEYRKSRKTVYAFAGKVSQATEPKVNSWEVDAVEFIDLVRAREIIHPDQRAFLEHSDFLATVRVHQARGARR